MVPLVVLAAALCMLAVERLTPGRPWPRVSGWWPRALLFNAGQVGAVFVSGWLWDGWLSRHRPWSADALGLAGGALLGYVVITFIYYWWHRWRHEVDWLWRWFHQLHHSPQRIELVTSFYKHPGELLANGLLSSVILYGIVGVAPVTAALAMVLTGLAELFYHWNVRTPHWVGYLVQRPESHCIHHQEGVHAYNYADLPLWDMLFGTWRNPRDWRGRCGFGAQGEVRVLEMLSGVDVNVSQARAGGGG